MKFTISWLYLLIVSESGVLATKTYLRLVGYGCDKLNIINENLVCPAEGNYSMAGTCESYVNCVKEKLRSKVENEPYIEFCDSGKNYVRGRCVPISDRYDCPQSHCKWIKEDAPSTSELPVTTISNSNVAVSQSNVNKGNIATGTSGQSNNFKCEEIQIVDWENGKTCPSAGNFTYFEDSVGDCKLYITCACASGNMEPAVVICEENEIFLGNKCVVNAESAKAMNCPQKKCRQEQAMKPKEYQHSCPAAISEFDDPNSPDYRPNNHNNHPSTTYRPKMSSASSQLLFINPLYAIFVLIANWAITF